MESPSNLNISESSEKSGARDWDAILLRENLLQACESIIGPEIAKFQKFYESLDFDKTLNIVAKGGYAFWFSFFANALFGNEAVAKIFPPSLQVTALAISFSAYVLKKAEVVEKMVDIIIHKLSKQNNK